MVYLFEAKVTYNEEGVENLVKKTFMVDASTYGEAEINISTYLNEYDDIDNFEIKNLKRVKYDDFVYKVEQEDYKWFEAVIKMKVDAEKEDTFVYLVADIGLREATKQVEDFVDDSVGDIKVFSIKEKEIADIVIRKVCCEVCVMNCDSNVRILSFDEQKDIDMKFSKIDEKNKALMKELGAVSLSHKKFVIKVNKKSLAKMEGKRIGQRVVKTWMEDFIDEDTTEVFSVERNEIVLSSGGFIDEFTIPIILDSKIKEIKLYL